MRLQVVDFLIPPQQTYKLENEGDGVLPELAEGTSVIRRFVLQFYFPYYAAVE